MLTQQNYIDDFISKRIDEFRNSGLGGRFLICRPHSLVGTRTVGNHLTEQNKIDLDEYHNRLTEALRSQLGDGQLPLPARQVLKLSTEAKNFLMMHAQYIEQEMRYSGQYYCVRESAGKMIENTCRIAALYELYGNIESTAVSLINAQHAFSAMSMYVDQYAGIVQSRTPKMQQIHEANLLLKWFQHMFNIGICYITRRQLMQSGPYQLRLKKFLDPLLQLLQENLRISILEAPGAKAGHTCSVYALLNSTPLVPPAI
jgi:hypothetical protein